MRGLQTNCVRRPRPDATRRVIMLKIGTYRRLREYLEELRSEAGTRGLTFDDAVGALLAEHETLYAAGREAMEDCLRERLAGSGEE